MAQGERGKKVVQRLPSLEPPVLDGSELQRAVQGEELAAAALLRAALVELGRQNEERLACGPAEVGDPLDAMRWLEECLWRFIVERKPIQEAFGVGPHFDKPLRGFEDDVSIFLRVSTLHANGLTLERAKTLVATQCGIKRDAVHKVWNRMGGKKSHSRLLAPKG